MPLDLGLAAGGGTAQVGAGEFAQGAEQDVDQAHQQDQGLGENAQVQLGAGEDEK